MLIAEADPTKSVTRDDYAKALVNEFKLPQEQADAVMTVLDGWADYWKGRNGITREDWYAENVGKVQTVEMGKGGEGKSLFQLNENEIIDVLSKKAEPYRRLEFTPENWAEEFGKTSTVNTPIGEVKLGENQYQKLSPTRSQYFGLIKPTLENPIWVIKDKRGGILFIKSFIDDTKKTYFVSVAYDIDGLKVVVTNRPADAANIKNNVKGGELLFYSDANTLGATSPMLDQLPSNASGHLDTNSIARSQEDAIPINYSKAYKLGTEAKNKGYTSYKDAIDDPIYWRQLQNSGHTEYVFFEAGLLGKESPRYVTGWRTGDIPEIGRSKNYKENVLESGVSVMELDNGDKTQDQISRMFIESKDRPKVYVKGLLNTVSRGSDGEPLLLDAEVINYPYKPLLQDGTPEPKGSTNWLENGKAVVTAWKNSDISTALHETTHVYLKSLVGVADDDIAVVTNWLRETHGMKDLDTNWVSGDIETNKQAHELVARALEEYHAEGKAPKGASEQLIKVFEDIKQWMLAIYKQIEGSQIDVQISDEMRTLFGKWAMGGDVEGRMNALDAGPVVKEPWKIEGEKALRDFGYSEEKIAKITYDRDHPIDNGRWKLTQKETVENARRQSNFIFKKKDIEFAKFAHKNIIEKALKEGKPVPAEVLADYPDLSAKYSQGVAQEVNPNNIEGVTIEEPSFSERLAQMGTPNFDLGQKFTEYHHDAQGAIAKLTELKGGDAIGALHHPEVGDIDLIWGNDKFGLSKISQKHPEIIDGLQDNISSTNIVSQSKNRIILESEKHKAIIRLDWDGENKRWLMTAYEKASTTPAEGTTDVLSASQRQTDTAPLPQGGDISSVAQAGMENNPNESTFDTALLDKIANEKVGKWGYTPTQVKYITESIKDAVNKLGESETTLAALIKYRKDSIEPIIIYVPAGGKIEITSRKGANNLYRSLSGKPLFEVNPKYSSPINPDQSWTNTRYKAPDLKDPVQAAMAAVRLYGTPENAIEILRRQLEGEVGNIGDVTPRAIQVLNDVISGKFEIERITDSGITRDKTKFVDRNQFIENSAKSRGLFQEGVPEQPLRDRPVPNAVNAPLGSFDDAHMGMLRIVPQTDLPKFKITQGWSLFLLEFHPAGANFPRRLAAAVRFAHS